MCQEYEIRLFKVDPNGQIGDALKPQAPEIISSVKDREGKEVCLCQLDLSEEYWRKQGDIKGAVFVLEGRALQRHLINEFGKIVVDRLAALQIGEKLEITKLI